MATVAYCEQQGNYARVTFRDGVRVGETLVQCESGETPLQAATRWARDAFGVALSSPSPTLIDILLADKTLSVETKTALGTLKG